ncbi:hypothetical protein AK812_SmicGene5126 [Symbiodinium microadriaticum]|uniref:Uncharacterized protein n=1 Tax=Symbiodinium microadriaticum TaxID=2951 RepID=A0A1Q9EUF8_SYMMI|nr:hypothetical protein AK812_SmicGene5126 [Symbiodinium microadriaticum]
MPKRAREDGLHALELARCSFKQWLQDVDKHCFASEVAFQKYLSHRRVLDEGGANVSLSLRAVGIFLKCGIALQIKRCTKCGKPARFEQRTSRGWTTCGWTRSVVGHKHMELQLNQHGFLTEVPVNSWFQFLHLINMLRLGVNWPTFIQELQTGYGNVTKKTLAKSRDVFQKALGVALDKMDCRVVGGKKETVVMDEAIVGVHPEDGWSVGSKGINKAGAEQTRKSARLERSNLVSKGAMTRLPARTLHGAEKASPAGPQLLKKPASIRMKRACGVMKTIQKKPAAVRPPAKRLKKTAANFKTKGAWLWLAVAVGKNKEVYTHDNGKKRITYRLLPSRRTAIKNKPRGFEEIQKTVEEHVAKGSYLVFDGWTATKKAVKALGYEAMSTTGTSERGHLQERAYMGLFVYEHLYYKKTACLTSEEETVGSEAKAEQTSEDAPEVEPKEEEEQVELEEAPVEKEEEKEEAEKEMEEAKEAPMEEDAKEDKAEKDEEEDEMANFLEGIEQIEEAAKSKEEEKAKEDTSMEVDAGIEVPAEADAEPQKPMEQEGKDEHKEAGAAPDPTEDEAAVISSRNQMMQTDLPTGRSGEGTPCGTEGGATESAEDDFAAFLGALDDMEEKKDGKADEEAADEGDGLDDLPAVEIKRRLRAEGVAIPKGPEDKAFIGVYSFDVFIFSGRKGGEREGVGFMDFLSEIDKIQPAAAADVEMKEAAPEVVWFRLLFSESAFADFLKEIAAAQVARKAFTSPKLEG